MQVLGPIQVNFVLYNSLFSWSLKKKIYFLGISCVMPGDKSLIKLFQWESPRDFVNELLLVHHKREVNPFLLNLPF